MSDFSHAITLATEAIIAIRNELTAPHVVLRPHLGVDGDQWSFLLGDNLMTGVSGFGDTPVEAAADFDRNWFHARTPTAKRLLAGRIEEEDRREEALANGQFGVGA